MKMKSHSKWRSACVEKLQNKLSQNLAKRKQTFEYVVAQARRKILTENTLNIVPNPSNFTISDTIINEAYERMSENISSWPGVDFTQCKKYQQPFKKYWRIADNWWHKHKGKWFGDLFFWPILQHSLHSYCKNILSNTNNQFEYDYLYYIFLHDILHSKVSFKKARPSPLIFDLALAKSQKLQQWFKIESNQHNVEFAAKTSSKPIEYAQMWVKTVKDRKLYLYMQYKSHGLRCLPINSMTTPQQPDSLQQVFVQQLPSVKTCILYHEPLVKGYWRILNENYSITSYSMVNFIHLCFMYYFDQTWVDTIDDILKLPSDIGYLTQSYVKQCMQSYVNCIGTKYGQACTTIHLIVNDANYCDESMEAKCVLCDTNMCLMCKERAHWPGGCDDTSSTKAQCGSDCDCDEIGDNNYERRLCVCNWYGNCPCITWTSPPLAPRRIRSEYCKCDNITNSLAPRQYGVFSLFDL